MHSPPKVFLKFLRWFCRQDSLEEIESNLLEIFGKDIAESSLKRARRRFAWNVVTHFRPEFMKVFSNQRSDTSNFIFMQMFFNYLSVASRVFKRNKAYVAINALGLGFALASCMAGYLFIAFNVEYNDYLKDKMAPNVHMIQMETQERDGSFKVHDQAPIMLSDLASTEFAGVGKTARFLSNGGSMAWNGNVFAEYFSYSDSSFFDLFNLPLVTGSHKMFRNKNAIFISEEVAKKYFGDTNPIGQQVVLQFNGNKKIDAEVGGVVAAIPVNTSVNFQILVRFEHFIEINGLDVNDWKDWRDPTTFIQLDDASKASSLTAHLQKYVQPRNDARMDMKVTQYLINSFESNKANGYGWVNRPISNELIIIFSAMALAILLIACFNLTNTSIALTARRLKEVGVRKTMGALRKNIASQFLLESAMMVVLAMMLGFVLAQFVVPVFANMWGLRYGLGDLNGINLVVATIFLVFVASILAGSYPALLGSALHPAGLLKGTHRLKGTSNLTRVLVTMQFALSTVVLIAGITFTQNAAFQNEIDFGYETDKILHVDIGGKRDFDLLANALASNPNVISVGVSDGALGRNTYGTPVRVGTEEYEARVLGIGNNYLETLGLDIVEGEGFTFPGHNFNRDVLIVNEAFVAKTGMKDPIGQSVTLHNTPHRIIGIVENHLDNLYRSSEPAPCVFHPTTQENYITLAVKAEKDDMMQVWGQLEDAWKRLFPGKPFLSVLQDDVLLGRSRSLNANLKEMFIFLTGLGGLLAVCGIFALASLNTSYRMKEIGVRKVLGATVQNVIAIMNREFLLILLVATLIGAYAGYYATTSLLDTMFAVHTSVGATTITLCCLLVFIAGAATTTFTVLKAARANPVSTLRSE